MKILFGIQATGNGHLSLAKEFIPYLQKYGNVDVLVSGIEAEVKLPYPIKYKKYGLGFIFGQKGELDFKKSFQTMKFGRLIKDIRELDVSAYDFICNDFEVITAWACKRKGIPCHGIGHIGIFLSNKIPRPKHRRRWAEFIIKHYAPTTTMNAFHYKRYDSFIHTPVIRKEIREIVTSTKNHVVVYLPAVSDKLLLSVFLKIKEVKWKVFSKRATEIYEEDNVTIYPISHQQWLEDFGSCEGAIMGTGFSAPAEALFLGKKLLTIPMFMQYEQECNAVALEDIGVRVIWKITKHLEDQVRDWLLNDKVIPVDYPDETEKIIDNMIKGVKRNFL